MIIDVRCVICKSSAREDVEDLLVMCGNDERYRSVLVNDVSEL